MNREELIKIIQENTMDTAGVLDYLNISKQRLSDMKRKNKIIEVKKGIFLRMDIELIKINQQDLREKYNKKSSYELFPIYKKIGNNLLINKLRFFDCVTMVKYKITNEIYNRNLEDTLNVILSSLEKDHHVYFMDHKYFDNIEQEKNIKENMIIKKFSLESYKEFLQHNGAHIIGLDKIGNYNNILDKLNKKLKECVN